MTYQEVFEKVKEALKGVDTSSIQEHIAFQFNVEGEGEGIFYVEVADGVLNVEPYDYYDYDVMFITNAEILLSIIGGKQDVMEAYSSGELKVVGNLEKALLLKELIVVKKVAVKKTTTKKKTTTTKKTTAGKKEPVEKVTAAKTTATKTTAAKTTATKTTAAKTTATKTTATKTTAKK